MAYQFPPNIERLVSEQMASGAYESRPGEIDCLRLDLRSAIRSAIIFIPLQCPMPPARILQSVPVETVLITDRCAKN
jgi:hypothetical protein